MSKPLIVTIPHQLGPTEAKRRLETGLAGLKAKFGEHVASVDERWTGNHLDLSVRALGQAVEAALDVEPDHVRVEVRLPWMLAMIAEKAKGYIQKEGQLLLAKKA
jgi:hypothetical protein